MIEISKLRVNRDGKTICAVEQFSVNPGERIAVIGSNGSGKTTLLRILAGLERDYSGNCRVDVRDCERTYLHQHPYLFRGSVLANARYGQRNTNKSNVAASSWLERLGIGHLKNRLIENLSGGEIRRVALARSLACQPRLLLLDEPLAELDPTANATVCEVLNDLPETTLIIASPTELPASLTTTTYSLKH